MIHFRKYTDYEEYKRHQKDKLNKRLKNIKSRSMARTDGFIDEFKMLIDAHEISNSAVLCLAARLGEEVAAWRHLGRKGSIGIDLNPGPNNDLVQSGDFHSLPFDDASFDTIYCNSLDHAFDLDKFTSECSRVLRRDGILLLGLNVDFCGLSAEDYVQKSGKYESLAWSTEQEVVDSISQFYEVVRVHVPLIRKTRPERFVFILKKR